MSVPRHAAMEYSANMYGSTPACHVPAVYIVQSGVDELVLLNGPLPHDYVYAPP